MDNDAEVRLILSRLLSGQNVLLVGPNQKRIRELLSHVSLELSKKAAVFEITSQDLTRSLKEATLAQAAFVFAESIDGQEALAVMCGDGRFVLFGAMPFGHVLGVLVSFTMELKQQLGEGADQLSERLAKEALSSVLCIGFGDGFGQPAQKGSFREKLEKASYTGTSHNDHNKLMRGWTSESNQCDPGWELDR